MLPFRLIYIDSPNQLAIILTVNENILNHAEVEKSIEVQCGIAITVCFHKDILGVAGLKAV